MKLACIGCGAVIRRSRSTWASCSQCSALVSAFLARTVGTRDPSAWVRALNQTFGNREAFCEAVAREGGQAA